MRALLHNPAVIYLDEPTKGLDPIISQRIRRFLKDYVRRENKTLLLTSHILTEVDELADRIALIYQGTIPITGLSDDLKASVGCREFIEIRRDAISPALEAQLLELPSVKRRMEQDSAWLTLGVADFFEAAQAVIPLLKSHGVTTGFNHRPVTLEDAFIHQVGTLSERFE
jgi:ABC-2 type transport system ATP-binding protein